MKPDISLDLYNIFCTVVRTGNMSAAAKELFITQPAVSMAVKQLEDKLGKPLLSRSPKGIITTAEGGVMYDYLSRALGLIETAEKKYAEMADLKTGEVRIGASDTIMSVFLLPYIERYLIDYPGINFRIINRTTYGTAALLKNAQVDVGFVNLPLEPDGSLEITECLTIRDCIIGGTKYAHLTERGLTFRDLAKYPLMLLEKNSNTRRLLDKFAAANGYAFSPAIELDSSDLLVRCAGINLGIAVVTREFTGIDNASVFEIPFHPRFPERAVGLIKLKGVGLSYAAGRFVNMLTGGLNAQS